MAFQVFDRSIARRRPWAARQQPLAEATRLAVIESNRRRRQPRDAPGDCPVCGSALPDKPSSQRRKFCSLQCAGVAKRGVPLGPR